MRPRPSVVSLALVVIALIHATWGVRMLANGNMLVALSQLVAAGGILLAGVAVASRLTFATGLGIAAGATSLRLLAGLAEGSGPWTGPTAALFVGLAAAAWGARRLDAPGPVGVAPLVLRGGFVLLAAGYAGFLALSFAFGGQTVDRIDLAVRVAGAVAIAIFVDAPPAAIQRKAFGKKSAMRAP